MPIQRLLEIAMGATPQREVIPGVEHSVVISGPGLQNHTKFKSPKIATTHPRKHIVSPQDHLDEDEFDTCLNGMKDERLGQPPHWVFKHSQVANDDQFLVVNLIWDSESIPPDLVRGYLS